MSIKSFGWWHCLCGYEIKHPAAKILFFGGGVVFGQKWGKKVWFLGNGYFWLAGVKILAAAPAFVT